MRKQTVTILGSTGSVGLNTLRVIREFPEQFEVVGLSAGAQSEALAEQVREFMPKAVYLADAAGLSAITKEFGSKLKTFTGPAGLREFSRSLGADILIAASSGTSALYPVLDALEAGKKVALANKEILVIAGSLVMRTLNGNAKASLIPVDSEHSAIFQCLEGVAPGELSRILLTSSGGPLRQMSKESFLTVTKEAVINHPKWRMGKKISVDSATLMNKGLEIIEAAWLFDVPIDKIEVLIHPEAVIHSMVELIDGSVLAQLGVADMRLPIRYALGYPGRLEAKMDLRLDFDKLSTLTFDRPDRQKFPCLDLAYAAARRSGSAPCVLSAADEVAVHAYLEDQIGFVEIPGVIEKVLSRHSHVADPDLESIRSIHDWAVEETKRLCQR